MQDKTFNDEKTAEAYDEKDPGAKISEQVLLTLRSFPWWTKGLSLLDYGCGTGVNTLGLISECTSVLAVDLSEMMLNQLKRKIVADPTKAVKLLIKKVNEDGSGLGTVGSVDVAISVLVFHHAGPNVDSIVSNLSKALKAGGHFVVFEFDPTEKTKLALASFKKSDHSHGGPQHKVRAETDQHHHGDHSHGPMNHLINPAMIQNIMKKNGLEPLNVSQFIVPFDGALLDCYAAVGVKKYEL